MSIESVMPSNHLILCRPLLFLPSIFPYCLYSVVEFSLISQPLMWVPLDFVPPTDVGDVEGRVYVVSSAEGLEARPWSCHFWQVFSPQGNKKPNVVWPTCCCSLVTKSLSDSFAISWTVARQAPLSMGFSRQEYWSELPIPSPGNLPPHGDQTCVSCIDKRVLYHWAIREAQPTALRRKGKRLLEAPGYSML